VLLWPAQLHHITMHTRVPIMPGTIKVDTDISVGQVAK
jgi:hypothetical protein